LTLPSSTRETGRTVKRIFAALAVVALAHFPISSCADYLPKTILAALAVNAVHI
jgi:hypothetical protein